MRDWCACSAAQYEDLGRPTLYSHGEARGRTLDFTLRNRSTGRVYVAEIKCELQFENYRHLRLVGPDQLRHHKSVAFSRFLALARDSSAYQVRVAGHAEAVDGAVLIWGAVTLVGREVVMQVCGFADVLSVESIVTDLRQWRPLAWSARLEELRDWSATLFAHLTAP